MKKKIGYGWIHIVDSLDKIREIHSYISSRDDVSVGAWVITYNSLVCKDNRTIGKKNMKNGAILTTTYSREPIIKMVDLGLISWDSTVELDGLSNEELTEVDFGRKIRNAKYYDNYEEFRKDFLLL